MKENLKIMTGRQLYEYYTAEGGEYAQTLFEAWGHFGNEVYEFLELCRDNQTTLALVKVSDDPWDKFPVEMCFAEDLEESLAKNPDGETERYAEIESHAAIDPNPYAIGSELIDKATARILELGLDKDVDMDLDASQIKGSGVSIPIIGGGSFEYDDQTGVVKRTTSRIAPKS